MVEDTLADGVRIAQLLASELHGHERGVLGRLAVVDADRDVEPSSEGSRAFSVRLDTPSGEEDWDDHDPLATVFVQPERVFIAFRAAATVAAETATDRGLRVDESPRDPDRVVVIVALGAQVKRVLPAFRAVVEAVEDVGESEEV